MNWWLNDSVLTNSSDEAASQNKVLTNESRVDKAAVSLAGGLTLAVMT